MSQDDTPAPEATAPEASDTAETQEESQAEDSQVSVPEVSEEAKAETEVKAEDTTEEKLLAGKYKSVEDLEKSYKELESKYGKEASEKAELSRALNEAFATPAQTQAADTGTDDYEEPTSADPEAEKLKRDVAVMKFIVSHSDADPATMKEILATDPLVAQIPGYEARLEHAYYKAKAVSQPKAVAEAQKEAQAQTVAKIAEKEIAQVESAKKAEPVEEESLLEKASLGKPDEAKEARIALLKKYHSNL